MGTLWPNVVNLSRNTEYQEKQRRYWPNTSLNVWMDIVKHAGKTRFIFSHLCQLLLLRWTDVFMLRTFLEAATYPGQPLEQLSTQMKWYISFSSEEISDLQNLLNILDPMELLFTKLGSETSSSIHLVVPTLLVSLLELSLPIWAHLTVFLFFLGSSQYFGAYQREPRGSWLCFCQSVVLSDPWVLWQCSRLQEEEWLPGNLLDDCLFVSIS